MILFKTFSDLSMMFMDRFSLKNVITYNLTSYQPGFTELNALTPYWEGLDTDSPLFDKIYCDFITDDRNEAFVQLMNIVLPVYMEPDTIVQILIRHSPVRDAFAEALAKLIQQRYGYNCYIVNTFEDLDYVNDDSNFSPNGLSNLDFDIQRYNAIMIQRGQWRDNETDMGI